MTPSKGQRETIPVRPDEQLPLEPVVDFLRHALPEVDVARLEIEQFPAGHSNLTYLLRARDWEAVLRRPPLGPVAPRAHDMVREFRILERLHPVFPLAPQPYAVCEDASLLGVPFYVMERRHGVVLDQSFPANWRGENVLHRAIAENLVDVLVTLHAVDWETAGLGTLGRPEGYLQRQVKGWTERYVRARTDDVQEAERLSAWLARALPESPAATVLHNDYKLNNVLLDTADPRQVNAVLDWEMATVGDPLSDVASLLVYWTEAGDDAVLGGLQSVTSSPGFPSRDEIRQIYAERSGRDLRHMDWYLAFAYFKVGVILQQIFYRWYHGQTHDDRFSRHNIVAANLFRQGARVAGLG